MSCLLAVPEPHLQNLSVPNPLISRSQPIISYRYTSNPLTFFIFPLLCFTWHIFPCSSSDFLPRNRLFSLYFAPLYLFGAYQMLQNSIRLENVESLSRTCVKSSNMLRITKCGSFLRVPSHHKHSLWLASNKLTWLMHFSTDRKNYWWPCPWPIWTPKILNTMEVKNKETGSYRSNNG